MCFLFSLFVLLPKHSVILTVHELRSGIQLIPFPLNIPWAPSSLSSPSTVQHQWAACFCSALVACVPEHETGLWFAGPWFVLFVPDPEFHQRSRAIRPGPVVVHQPQILRFFCSPQMVFWIYDSTLTPNCTFALASILNLKSGENPSQQSWYTCLGRVGKDRLQIV